MLSYDDALNTVTMYARTFPPSTEEVPLEEAHGRVLAKEVISDRNYPPFHRSAMDGIAIKADNVEEGITSFRIKATILAGQSTEGLEFDKGDAVKIMTGAAVPEGLDAVIRREDCDFQDDTVKVTAGSARFFQNIAIKGEDAPARAVLMPPGKYIDHSDMGLLSTFGYAKVKVHKQPKIGIIVTGNEIKAPDEPVSPYEIRDSNSFHLIGMLAKYGVRPHKVQRCKDDQDAIAAAIENTSSCDIVLLTGGVSMGEADFVPQLLEQGGIRKVFHKTAIKPGKPMWFGVKGNERAVFGLPGNPLSTQVTFSLYVKPFLHELFRSPLHYTMYPLDKRLENKKPIDVFVPVSINHMGCLRTHRSNGSGDVTASLDTAGLVRLSPDSSYGAGDYMSLIPW